MKIIGRCLILIVLCLAWGKTGVADTDCDRHAPFALTLDDDSLSLDGRHACLGMILEALADQGSVQIHVPPSVAGQPVSASFQNLPIQQGIRQMLKGMNYALENKIQSGLRAGGPHSESEKIRLWVFSKLSVSEEVARQTDDRKEPPDKMSQDDTLDLRAMAEQSRSASNPRVRAYALQLIAQTDDMAGIAGMLLAGLQDPAPEVLNAALGAAADLGPRAAARVADRIAMIALYNERPELRKQALRTLIEGNFPPEITAAVMADARYDNDSGVNNLADKLFKLVTPRPAHSSGR